MTGALIDVKMLEARVVILDQDDGPEVGVADVPCPAEVGVEFEHDGRLWQIFGRRRGTRVLLATECSCTTAPELRA